MSRSARYTLDQISAMKPGVQAQVARALGYDSNKDPYATTASLPLPSSSGRQVQAPKLERPLRHDMASETRGEGAHEGRFRVSVRSYRRVLLDCDNLYGGAKFLVDCCRYFWLVPDDNPQAIELQVTQEKVTSKELEHTQITIERIIP